MQGPARFSSHVREAFSEARNRSSKHASAWFFAPIAGVLVPFIGRSLGVDLTFVPFFPEGLVRSGIDAAICVAIVYALLYGCYFVWFLGRAWGLRLNLWIVLASVGAVLMLLGAGGYLWDLSRGPVIWDWGFRWLNNNYVPALNRIVINRFEIVGDNRWDDPIVISEAYIRSDITNQRIDMDAHLKAGGNTWTSTTMKVVPSKGRFLLYGKFNPDPNNYQGLPDNEFKDQFRQFSFFFNGKLVRRFYPNDVEKLIQKLQEGAVKNPD